MQYCASLPWAPYSSCCSVMRRHECSLMDSNHLRVQTLPTQRAPAKPTRHYASMLLAGYLCTHIHDVHTQYTRHWRDATCDLIVQMQIRHLPYARFPAGGKQTSRRPKRGSSNVGGVVAPHAKLQTLLPLCSSPMRPPVVLERLLVVPRVTSRARFPCCLEPDVLHHARDLALLLSSKPLFLIS